MKWPALKYELDVAADYARPGNSPPEIAFQVLDCGFDLLVELSRSGVPTLSRKAQKRAGKWLLQNVPYREGPMAVNMLAVALPIVMARTGGDLYGAIDGRQASAEQHAKLEDVVTDFYPLPAGRNPMVVDALAEFEVLDTKSPRGPVVNGVEPGTAYSKALSDGEDPDLDPALVAEQRRWARDYFLSDVTYWSCERILDLDFVKFGDEITRLVQVEDGVEEYRERLLAAWVRGSETYREYALLDETG